MGGEGTGWALDADVATTKESLSALKELIEFTNLEEADVVHSVWEWPLLNLPEEKLAGKRILCHVCNDIMRTYEQPCMIHASRVGLWITQSRQAELQLNKVKYNQIHIPYAIDIKIFTEKCPPSDTVQSIRERFNIPKDIFVISNFMRDTLGANLRAPKDQKGAEVFLGIAQLLHQQELPIHILLAGPRRHWIRERLRENGIPYTFIGKEVKGDDNSINILEPSTINLLYHASDLHLVTSRWEGGPRAVLEAAATKTPILSTHVGIAADVLEPKCLFSDVDEGAFLIEEHISGCTLGGIVDIQFKRIMDNHLTITNIKRFGAIYEQIENIPAFVPRFKEIASSQPIESHNPLIRFFRRRRPGTGLRIGLWHEFHKPPYGGGNQFLMALKNALLNLGARVESNRFSNSIQVHLCNSAWFAVDDFMEAARSSKKSMVHRVDGPIALYRGQDWQEDIKIYDLNARLALATVYQSGWCFSKLHELGFRPVSPVIIHNAVDDRIFNSYKRIKFSKNRKIRLVATAWSDNPKKGGPFFKWLENELDWSIFEFTFVGRTQEKFEFIQHIPPQSSKPLADILREHDIYIMASQHEACSNALLEALSCGLPVLYLDEGANGELTQFGGLAFNKNEEAIPQLTRLVDNYELFQQAINVRTIDNIALKYIELFQEVLDS